MVTLIDSKSLKSYKKNLDINYSQYLKWLDDDLQTKGQYVIISTSIVDIRDRSEWNTKGREIYDREKMIEHAHIVFETIDGLNDPNKKQDYLAMHESNPAVWFPKNSSHSSLFVKRSKIFSALNGNLHSFDGGFLIEHDSLNEFLEAMCDYSYILKYRDLDIFSRQQPLLLKVTAHLSMDFIFPSSAKHLENLILDRVRHSKLRLVIEKNR